MECLIDMGDNSSQIHTVLQRHSTRHCTIVGIANYDANVVFGPSAAVEVTAPNMDNLGLRQRRQLLCAFQSQVWTQFCFDYSCNSGVHQKVSFLRPIVFATPPSMKIDDISGGTSMRPFTHQI